MKVRDLLELPSCKSEVLVRSDMDLLTVIQGGTNHEYMKRDWIYCCSRANKTILNGSYQQMTYYDPPI